MDNPTIVGAYSELWIACEVAKKRAEGMPSQGGTTGYSTPTLWRHLLIDDDGACYGWEAVRYEVGTPGGKP